MDINDLLKEAKPLYKQRKRRKTIAKMIFSITLPAILFSSLFQIYIEGCNIYLSLEQNSLQTELLDDDWAFLR